MAEEHKQFDVDAILDELQAKGKHMTEDEEALVVRKPVFELHLDLDSEYGEAVETAPVVREEPVVDVPETPVHTEKEPVPAAPRYTAQQEMRIGCLKAIIYGVGVLTVSILVAVFASNVFFDFTGLGRSVRLETVTIPEGASTETVAQLLEEKGMITDPFIFRMYVRLKGGNGSWYAGDYQLAPNMGYNLLLETMQTAQPSETITVTIPEGFTVEKIARRLEENKVCTATEFYRALTEVDYSAEYDFLREAQDTAGYASRIYKLEGYLFPDTYQFYENSTGEAVVRRFLDNFGTRLNTTVRAAMSAQGITMDELIVLASVVQGEAANDNDMSKVARVLYNRLDNAAAYPKLECDSTRDYLKGLSNKTKAEAAQKYYNTYDKEGLPVGAINNPGMDAINAVLFPSKDGSVTGCYFFATDYDTGITYYSKTLAQHESICRKYGIGMYG